MLDDLAGAWATRREASHCLASARLFRNVS
jgi:hypothetical protein